MALLRRRSKLEIVTEIPPDANLPPEAAVREITEDLNEQLTRLHKLVGRAEAVNRDLGRNIEKAEAFLKRRPR